MALVVWLRDQDFRLQEMYDQVYDYWIALSSLRMRF